LKDVKLSIEWIEKVEVFYKMLKSILTKESLVCLFIFSSSYWVYLWVS